MPDDGGDVLGNLPRSRPGKRSAKRDTAAKAKPKPKPAVAKPRPKAQRPKVASRTAASPPSRQKAAPQRTAAQRRGDPVGDAVGAAVKVAETGLKVASGLTREVLRRLPRP